jgi:uncharacterized protein YkwD
MKKLLFILAILLSFTATSQTAEELEMVDLVNQVRTNPKSFIPVIEDYIKTLESKSNVFADIKITGAIVTKKTNNASTFYNTLVCEAKKLIIFLNNVKPVCSLELSNVLYPITKNHATYLDSINILSHIGPNGQTLSDRTKNTSLMVGENCAHNSTTAINTLTQLLIDLGVKSKGHRNNIFNPKYKKISVARVGDVWVQNFSF